MSHLSLSGHSSRGALFLLGITMVFPLEQIVAEENLSVGFQCEELRGRFGKPIEFRFIQGINQAAGFDGVQPGIVGSLSVPHKILCDPNLFHRIEPKGIQGHASKLELYRAHDDWFPFCVNRESERSEPREARARFQQPKPFRYPPSKRGSIPIGWDLFQRSSKLPRWGRT